jgi:selenocysteine lyase/cysteine desulfurase
MNRKSFISGIGLGTLGVLTGSGMKTEPTDDLKVDLPVYDPTKDAEFWRAVRQQYVLKPELHYMNTGGLGPAAKPVLKVFADAMHHNQTISEHDHHAFEGVREVVAGYFGAQASEFCFTRNATEGNSIVAAGLVLQEGDEVIFEDHAHPGGSGPWYLQQHRRGVVIKLFTPDPDSAEVNLQRIRELITPRTKVIQISHVTAPTGILLPAAEIAKLAHEHGLWFHIDGAQTAGMFPFTMGDLGCDSYATSGHKWMGAPHETGILFIRKDRNDEVIPCQAGSYTGKIPCHLPGELEYVKNASRHEYGTRNAASILGIGAAVEFQVKVGRDRIAAHGRALALQLREGLAKIPSIEVLTSSNPGMSGSITGFRTPRIYYTDLLGVLSTDHHFRLRPVSEQGLDSVRVSTHLFNSAQECELLLAAINDIVRKA